MLISFLAQMNPSGLLSDGMPTLSSTGSDGLTWVLAALLTTGILLVTFKTTKRNHLERE